MIKVNQYKRKTKCGYSLYLDYRINGVRHQEATGLQILDGNDTYTKQLNKDTKLRFAHMKFEKQKQLMDGIIIPLQTKRQRIDFFQYFEEYMQLNPSKERRNSSTLKQLKNFWGKDTLPITEINEKTLKLFKIYLEEHLTGETPYDYFKALKAILKQATKEGLFLHNPAADIKVARRSNEAKVSLTFDELNTLYKASCPNENVKRAFLFSCYTGLRFCDIKKLCWNNISDDGILKMVQSKTNHPVSLKLVDFALALLGRRGEPNDLIFSLPTGNGTNKNLRVWAKNAEIEKKVTYHCARHSFATNLFSSGVDIYTTSAAMGHKSLKETPRYVKIAQHTIADALQKMQQIQ